MGEKIDERERRELCVLLNELGPDAPTLCEGWTTADLAAHLVLREHFKRWGDDKLAAEKAKGFDALVDTLRAGAPIVPWRIPGVRTALNGAEFFIHHEDVRRANGLEPRPHDAELEAMSWRMVGLAGRGFARKLKPSGLTLQRPDGGCRNYGPQERIVLAAPPTELLLYLSGRHDAARVAIEGSAVARDALENATT